MSNTKPYVIRDIPDEIDKKINEKFDNKKFVGHTSPRQRWGRALFYIGALDPDQSIQAFALWQRSLQNAMQRGEAVLRDEPSVRQKIEEELQEFSVSIQQYQRQQCLLSDVANRLSNILYYAVQIYVQDGNIASFERLCAESCTKAGFPQLVAFRIANEKYSCRIEQSLRNQPKDIVQEYRRIQRILDEFSQYA